MLRALNLVSVMNTMRRGLELEVLPSLTPLSEEGTYIWRDVPYVGPDSSAPAQRAPTAHDKHCVDVFIPDKPFPRPALPVALFVHGGAWQRGDRQSRLNTYGNVGIACARAGIVGVVMSYRLAPEFRHPAQVRDVASAVAWVQRNIHQYGGDGANLFLCGHSAGAHLAMLAAAQPRWLREARCPDPVSSIRGVVGISGIFNLVRLAQTPLGPYLVEPVFGDDPTEWREASPAHYTGPHSPLCDIPLLLLNAASDFHLEQDAEELDTRLQASASENAEASTQATQRPCIRRHIVPDRNHASIIAAVGQPDDTTSDLITSFIHEFSQTSPASH